MIVFLKRNIQYFLITIILPLTITDVACAQAKPGSATLVYAHEKVYVHMDRDQYVAGDTVWFNAYVVNATFHTPKVLSRTLYVNLYSQTGQLVTTCKLLLDSTGRAPGDITLPDSLSTGTYQVEAYTNWMRNAGNDFLFRQRIWIEGRSPKVITAEANSSIPGQINLQIFPEGGNLVDNVLNRVAFHVTNDQGHGLSVKGILIDERGDTLTDLRSAHQGMGIFTFIPHPNHRYRFVVLTADKQTTSVSLPVSLSAGCLLAVDNLTKPHSIRVQVRNTNPTSGRLVLFAHLRGQVCYQAQLDATRPEIIVTIPNDSIKQDGILHLTLFDPTNRPVAERLVFVNQHRQLSIHLQTDQTRYQALQPVTLSISVADPLGKPVQTRLSIAITDAQQTLLTESVAATLPNYLLLLSDLRGAIEKPEFYFDATQPLAPLYLDYLMMTHGWRRFNWQTLLSDSTSQPGFGVEVGLTLRGKVKYADGKVTKDNLLSGMLKTNQALTPFTVSTDQEGQFVLRSLLFSDTATLIIRHKTKRPIQLHMLNAALPDFVKALGLPFTSSVPSRSLVNKALETQAFAKRLQRNGGVMLQAVQVKANRLDASRKDYRRQLYGQADATVTATEQMRSGKFTVLQLLQGQVPGVEVGLNGDGSGVVKIRGGTRPAAIMIDGVMSSQEALATISPNDVEAIDVLKNPATVGALGVQAGDGAINILTRRNLTDGKTPGQVMAKVVGYRITREFYSPVYPAGTSSATVSDHRATLYWNPSVQTDTNGRATLIFYTPSANTTIHVNVQGIDAAGLVGSGKYNLSSID